MVGPQGGSRMKERQKTKLRGWALLMKPQPFYGLNVLESANHPDLVSVSMALVKHNQSQTHSQEDYFTTWLFAPVYSTFQLQSHFPSNRIGLAVPDYVGSPYDKSIRKKRHETQHPGIEENHEVKLLLDRLEKTGISANKLSPALWKHISDCYSGADCSSAVSKGIVTQLVGLPAVKVFRLPIGGKIKRLKSNLCNVIEDSTPKSKFTHQDTGQSIIKTTKNIRKTKKRTKPCGDTSFGTAAQQSTLENVDNSSAPLDSNRDTLSNPDIEQSLQVRNNACTKIATAPPPDLEDFELECVLPKFVITKDNPVLTESKDSDQEVNNKSNHCPEGSTSPIQKSIVQCGDSTEHNEIISTKEEPIDIVEDIYETEFVSVSEDFNQKLTPELNVTAKTEKETEFVEVEEMFDGKSTTEPRDIPIVREESHFIIVDTASQDIKTESIWDSNSFELLEARSNDSNILDKAHTDVPPTVSVIGNDAERIIDYTDTNDNIESEPFDNCDQPTFSVSSSLWQKHIANTSPLRANLLDPVLEYEINQDIPTALKRSGAINLQPAVPQKTRKIAPKQIPTQQSIYTATNPNNSGLQEGVNTVVEGFSQPISQQPSIAAPQTKIQQDTIISFQQLEENKNLPVSLQDVSNTKYQPLHASISLVSASNVHPEMKPRAYSQNSLHTLNNIKQPSLDNLQSPVVPSVVSQASTMARSSWHVVQKDCNEMIAVGPPHTLGMQITNDTVNPSDDVTKASAHHLSFQKATSSPRWDSQSQITLPQNHVTTAVQSPLQNTASITPSQSTTVVIPSDSDSCRNTATSQSSVETDVYRQEADDLFYNIYSSSNTISNSKSLKNVELENNPILENTTDDDNDNGWESCENNFEDENHHNSNVETCGQVDVQIGDSENFEKYILRSANKIICKLCEKSFEQNEEYKSHMKLHLKASHFFCRKCKIDVPIISFLNFHLNSCMKNLPPKDLVVLSSDDEPEPTPEANYKCKVCGEKFGFRINLKYHKETHLHEMKFTSSDGAASLVLGTDLSESLNCWLQVASQPLLDLQVHTLCINVVGQLHWFDVTIRSGLPDGRLATRFIGTAPYDLMELTITNTENNLDKPVGASYRRCDQIDVNTIINTLTKVIQSNAKFGIADVLMIRVFHIKIMMGNDRYIDLLYDYVTYHFNFNTYETELIPALKEVGVIHVKVKKPGTRIGTRRGVVERERRSGISRSSRQILLRLLLETFPVRFDLN
uniref:C2H2-type domain-containing protein n=1 Tax=Timema bartmani TaxID=61472 RepID=A0A7R9EQW7_9NEOP|nr:unnamed protein product [Timema bartmani]